MDENDSCVSALIKSSCTPKLTKRFSGIGLGVGGPFLIYWVTPTEEELFKACHMTSTSNGLGLTSLYQRYNPDLQKRSLQNRQGTQQDFDDFVGKLKEYSRSDKPSVSPFGESWYRRSFH